MPSNNAKIVDVHYHTPSPEFAKKIVSCVPIPDVITTQSPHINLDLRVSEEEQLEMADKNGIDVMVLSTRAPLYFNPKVLSVSSPHYLTVAKTMNDYYASVIQRYPGRFMALATIPLAHGDEAIKEMQRSLNELHLHGICLQTTYDGKSIALPEFRPFFEEANKLKAVAHVHAITPTAQINDPSGTRLDLPFDVAFHFVWLVFAGVMERCPDITFILGHGGGPIPFLWQRIDRAYTANRETKKFEITAPPSTYLKRCYYDTAVSDTESLMLTYKRVGADHVIFGTDSAGGTKVGNIWQNTLKSVKAMDISDGDKAKILGGTALALLPRSH